MEAEVAGFGGVDEAGGVVGAHLENDATDLPIALAKWDDYVKWVLDRVDGFPKNQRFVLGTRLADAVLEVMEVLAEATY